MDAERWEGKMRPLLLAVGEGHLPLAELLLEHGAEVEARFTLAATGAASAGMARARPLLFATESGFLAVAKQLLVGSNIRGGGSAEARSASDDGTQPLHVAAQRGDLKLAERLASRGAEVTPMTMKSGVEPLAFAWFTAAPASSSIADTSECPSCDAPKSGVQPLASAWFTDAPAASSISASSDCPL